ncbi:XPG/RAD2 endonuclease [Penicillium alfredii]|uniref:XPG/RAD2 endonuclease n=1 Tax=Penicillium alfredii TaxID=1506179 RepID=A0A9W9F8Y5_9EURO|nr:XPG/RAD2 endonuclease [Penicillium alfredii]KAJ5095838.1 XPG/RAD2 endonuclease [Penicillium alfredii]
MGVTGLWTVLQPCARPIKLETLNKKRLAVDASIWIYQFLKAVRDQEGNALRNSHIVGFFRRICKLLYFGIRPVFVFDGGAPVLKRQTIAGRKQRREGRREDAARTAGKLLAAQMQRSAEEEAEARRNKRRSQQEETVPDVPVYADETLMTEKERQQSRRFKKKDAYHLPNMDVSLEEMGAPNDPRIMSQEELEEYARQFHQGQDINLYDFSKIDFDGPFFISLPATDRYNILNAARLRSRLRMGYSKEQLDRMFPDRMAFSKFQIDRVAERNDLTQRLMNINGMNGEEAFYNSGQRIAGERGKEYVLVKDSEHEGGWVLGVVGNKDEGREDKPIDVDQHDLPDIISEPDEASDEDVFEDVPIEGLNRLPRLPFLQKGIFDQSLEQARESSGMRRAFDESRQTPSQPSATQDVEDDSLFVRNEQNFDIQDQNRHVDSFFEDEEDDDLQKALALSLQHNEDHDEEMPEISINRPIDPAPLHKPAADPAEESDDDGMDFAAAVAQTRVSKKRPALNPFNGPLPFESIQLTKSKKDAKPSGGVDEDAGGFVKEPNMPKKTEPLPPWFVGERSNADFILDAVDDDPEKDQEQPAPDFLFRSARRTPEVIDVDQMSDTKEAINLEADSPKDKEDAGGDQVEETTQADDVEEKPHDSPAPNPNTLNTTHADSEVSVGQVRTDKVTGEIRTGPSLDQPQTLGLGEQPSRVEASPSPEFEDVFIQPPAKAPEAPKVPEVPEITIFANEHPRVFEEVGQPAALLEDQGEYSDPEDEDLLRQLAAEGEEHVRFAKILNSAAPDKAAFDYEQELKQLRSQQKKDRRDADEVTQIMINECQQLLTLFGLPYITAPMEAEAQCAELVSLGLVDGIVTDDSDTFLFGGTRVYKNMFNQSKYVECYLATDFEKEYALHRQKLISFAYLLGSDYTEGIPGIGPVTALEILTEFTSLEEFRDWWTQIQMGINIPDDVHLAFRKKFRKKASKIFLPPAFPDARVAAAYLEPEVDSDRSQFQWGVPDLNGLRHFLMTTVGWSQERTDEILVPVIRDMNRRDQEGTQSNITQFMQGPQGAGAFAPRIRSGGASRMEKAFSRLRQEAQTGQGSGVVEDGVDEPSTSPKPSKRRGSKNASTDTSKKRKTPAGAHES